MSTTSEQIEGLENTAAKSAVNKRKFYDRLATWVVSLGGIAVILSIILILVFISIEVLPLWQKPKHDLESQFQITSPQSSNVSDNPVSLVGTEEYSEIGFVLFKNGIARFFNLEDGSIVEEQSVEAFSNGDLGVVQSTYVPANNKSYAVATDLGWVVPFDTNYRVVFDKENNRSIIPKISESEPIKLSEFGISNFAIKESEEGSTTVAVFLSDDGKLIYKSISESEAEENEFSFQVIEEETSLSETSIDLTEQIKGTNVTAIQIDNFLNNLYVGTKNGKIFNWNISNKENPTLKNVVDVTNDQNSSISALSFLLGNRSLLVGDSKGNVSIWFQTNDESGKQILQKVHELPSLGSSITEFSNSPRGRGFIASDEKGNIGLYQATSEAKQLELIGSGSKYNSITFSPKANGIISVDNKGNLNNWSLDNPHPETSFKTLFGKVWYEGYSKPEYVWQSTGGTDDFEPKLSITPLIYGTLKGAFYALFFAIPLAIFSAICVSQFMHPTHRNIIKPIIELMAALPSVILGFFAGLWLAPVIEKIFPALVSMFLFITIFTIIGVYVWKNVLPSEITGRFRVGSELFLLIPVVIFGILLGLGFNGTVENLIFSGDYKAWFYNVMGLQFDQRNSLIVGFAMGFAVIPIIFTISEDALSSVPRNLTAGSLALGANSWQTAIKIVLPSASPGIFSAIMIGLGRAVGETMIVLMATGNTPIMDWSFFNGFRALSANIAVELPEAPHGGTLYRTLFLTALILFAFTFVLNTLAEFVRQRLRKKYGQL